ncbi:MAG: NADH-quinone oxidoreductase subunit J [Magnetococcales bacterium]|nr:NADH-quinone oxidoreductase subunit J [Magnetococcales bacterium]
MVTIAELVFYFFAVVTAASALLVITARNPVHSVLFLVLTFFSTAGLFVLLEAEFLAAILVIVYMGAVAILFLFVVMMLDVDFVELRRQAKEHLPVGLAVGGLVLVELVATILTSHYHLHPDKMAGKDNTLVLGQHLYSQFLYPFEVASMILLVALIGAVVLTHRKRSNALHQDIGRQVARRRDQAVELRKVASGEGAKKS